MKLCKREAELLRAVITSTAVEIGAVRARRIEKAIGSPNRRERALRNLLLRRRTD